MSVCDALATTLNTQYQNSTQFDDSSASTSLQGYLASVGILTGICENLELDCLVGEENEGNLHLSGSWLQESTTGPRHFIPGSVGLILDPFEVEILCTYPFEPFDALRQDYGCGILENDPSIVPLPWGTRQILKSKLEWLKKTKFPSTEWQDIPCSGLFDKPDGALNEVWGMVDHNATWATLTYPEKVYKERALGHVACFDDSTPTFHDGMIVRYFGVEAWSPTDWSDMIASMSAVVNDNPNWGIWNKIIMDNSTEMSKAVRGVYYLRDESSSDQERQDRDRAAAMSKKFGEATVVRLDPHAPRGNVIDCPVSMMSSSQ